MRVGIFGGSFDPPHVGHLLVAQDAREALALDRLVVIPASQQPLKGHHATPAEHRLAMVRAMFDGVPGMVVDPIEIDRGGLSFMVDTVESLQRRWPSAALHLLVGDDVVTTLSRWRDVDRLLTLVQLVVLQRAFSEAPAFAASLGLQDGTGLTTGHRLATRRVDVTSTEIRARVQQGRSIKGFVPDSVAAYIASAGLYIEKTRAAVVVERSARD